eukprot:scaffold3248_cov171-Alexandrium_tamarense.AAC.5
MVSSIVSRHGDGCTLDICFLRACVILFLRTPKLPGYMADKLYLYIFPPVVNAPQLVRDWKMSLAPTPQPVLHKGLVVPTF